MFRKCIKEISYTVPYYIDMVEFQEHDFYAANEEYREAD